MSFEEYLISKKIESAEFLKNEPALWTEWSALFEQMSPASFTAQKLYLINPVRRKYPLRLSTNEAKKDSPKVATRPVFKPKIQ